MHDEAYIRYKNIESYISAIAIEQKKRTKQISFQNTLLFWLCLFVCFVGAMSLK